MRAWTQMLLVYTCLMLAIHLVSSWLLRRRWMSELALLRFEAAYYVLLVVYAVMTRTPGLVIAVAVLAAIHLVVWAVYETRRRPASVVSNRVLIAVQVFDWGEAVVLVWIASVVWRSG